MGEPGRHEKPRLPHTSRRDRYYNLIDGNIEGGMSAKVAKKFFNEVISGALWVSNVHSSGKKKQEGL